MHAFDRDRRTDRRTDIIPIARPRLHSMQRGKNCERSFWIWMFPSVALNYNSVAIWWIGIYRYTRIGERLKYIYPSVNGKYWAQMYTVTENGFTFYVRLIFSLYNCWNVHATPRWKFQCFYKVDAMKKITIAMCLQCLEVVNFRRQDSAMLFC